MVIKVIDTIKPNGLPLGQTQFPTVEDIDTLGGFQVQPDDGFRTGGGTIPVANQKVGMLVYEVDNTTYYTLTATGTPGTWAVADLGGGGTTSLFIFKPGGTPGGNVYTTEPSIATAMTGIEGATLLIDLSIAGSYTFTTVGALDLGIATKWVIFSTTPCGMTFSNETSITHLPVSITSQAPETAISLGQTANLTTVPTGTIASLTLSGFMLIATASGSGHFCDVLGSLFLSVGNFIEVQGAGATVFYADTGSTITLAATDNSLITNGALSTTPVGSQEIVIGGPNVFVDPGLYPYITGVSTGFFIDIAGTGLSTIPPGANNNVLMLTGGVLYQSNGATWVALDHGVSSFSGDVAATITSGNAATTVNGILSHTLPSLTTGYLYWNGTAWAFNAGAGGGITSLFIFQPGGTAGGNVYTDETSLSTALTGTEGATLLIDLSQVGGTYTFTTVGALEFGVNTNWVLYSATNFVLTFSNGTTINNIPASITAQSPQCQIVVNQAANLMSLVVGKQLTLLFYGETIVETTSTGSFIDVSGILSIFSGDQSAFTGPTAPVFNSEVGSGITITVKDSSALGVGTLSLTPGGSQSILVGGSSAQVDSSLYPFIGVVQSSLFIDISGTGLSTIPASATTDVVLQSGGAFYKSNGTSWIPISSSTFVFQPGGTAGGNIYTTEAGLQTALTNSDGATIIFDLSQSSGSYTFTTVGALNLGSSATWVLGTTTFQSCNLLFANGTALTYPPAFINSVSVLTSITVNQATSLITVSVETNIVIDTVGTEISATSTGDFLDSNGVPTTIAIKGSTFLTGTAPGYPFAGITGGTIYLNCYDAAFLSAGSVPLAGSIIEVFSSGVSVNSSLYSAVSSNVGLYVDTSGTATSTIPAADNSNALLFSNNTLYQSNGTSWLVVPIPGSGTNEFSGSGTIANINSTETILGASSAVPVKGFVVPLNTTDNTFTTIASYTQTDNTVIDWSITLTAVDITGAPPVPGNYYRADLFFTTIAIAGTTTINPTTPTPTNIRFGGTGTSYNAQVIVAGDLVSIQVQGLTATSIDWSCIGQAQIVS